MSFTQIYFTIFISIIVILSLIVFVGKIYSYISLKKGDIILIGTGWGDTFKGTYLGETKFGELRVEKNGIIYNVESKYLLSKTCN